ncbi:hypothetical protein FB645_001213 [Coemansia sp. IMI 203386]|nr:hypothetical protein FB645_001213 [Coemansia sp. IMI 203386]
MMAADDVCVRACDEAAVDEHVHIHQRASRRAKVAAEILETERTYVSGLGLIEKLYISPLLLSAQQPAAILSRKEVRQMFANFPDIITLSRELLSQLESRLGPDANPTWDAETGRIGDIFLRIAPFLKMYSLYLRNFRSALADISRWLSTNQEFARFIQLANSSPECKGLSFQSYLLLPVQRIPRYKLLLEDLLKHTPLDHVDHQSIGDALRTIEDVAAFVNENIQEHEMTLSIIEIQRTLGLKEPLLVPGRRLVKTGVLTKICRKNHQQRHFYLFSDILLYSSHQTPLGEDQSGHRRVPLEDCKVMDIPDTYDCRNQFTIISREKSFIVYAPSVSEKHEWMGALMRAITEQREARETLQMDSSLKRRIARARRSTMMQFPRVAENFDAPVWDPDESAERCYICFRDFSLFMRKHHCRACGKIVCNSCSRKNIMFVAQDSTEAKEGRGCDQCIARLFGREALESPPSTIHKILSRSRHSLDPSVLIQSISSLTMGPGTLRNLHTDSPILEEEPHQCEEDAEERIEDNFALPSVAQLVVHGSSTAPFQFGYPPQPSTGESTPVDDSARASQAQSAAIGGMARGHFMPTRPSTPLPASARISTSVDRTSSVSELASTQCSSSLPRTNRLSAILARRFSKHSSTGSALDWDSLPTSARSTVLYETSPSSLQPLDPHSPISTLSHHRVSFVSSSCSTVVSESSQRFRRARTRRPIAFTVDGGQPVAVEPLKPAVPYGVAGSHCSLLALYESPATRPSTPLQPVLISHAAPPKLTLVQAEATAARMRKPANATLCSLCHGDFDQQHQCASCLSLVCPRCISHKSHQPAPVAKSSGTSTPNFSRILSMYIPEGYDRLSGGLICTSCAARPSSIVEGCDEKESVSSNSEAVFSHPVFAKGRC